MIIEWPQLIFILSYSIGLGMELVRNGEEKKGKHCFISQLIATVIGVTVLYYGGFWG